MAAPKTPRRRSEDVHRAPWSVRLRRQFNWWTRWWPDQLLPARRRALRLWGHSTIAGVYNFAETWHAWTAANPDDPRAAQEPFTPEILARSQIAWLPALLPLHINTMATAWDACGDRLPCSVCWQHSATRRALDYALADAMGWTRSSMDAAAEQVAAAHRLVSSVGLCLPPSQRCEMPARCVAVASDGEAALAAVTAR